VSGYNTWELTGVLVREEYKMDWRALAEAPGFEHAEQEGVEAKFFGQGPGKGPFAYLLRFPPGAHLGARRHGSNLMRFVLEGDIESAGQTVTAGWYAYVPAGCPVPPARGGGSGCRTLEIFDGPPRVEPAR
jgi:hypothetical protein